MSRKWPKAEQLSLARYIDDFKPWLPLPGINRLDLEQQAGGRLKIIEAIYNALSERSIQYAHEKYRPDDKSQEIRGPLEIVPKEGWGEGTCLDLSLFFAGICLGNDLVPVVMVTEGHAYCLVSVTVGKPDWEGFNRQELGIFQDGLVGPDKIGELQELVNQGRYVAVECTGFAANKSMPDTAPEGKGRDDNGLMTFERALEAGKEQLASEEDRLKLRFALDVAVAHYGQGIDPPPAEPDTITVQTGAGVPDPQQAQQEFAGTLADKANQVAMSHTEHGTKADNADEMPDSHELPRPVLKRGRKVRGYLGREQMESNVERFAQNLGVVYCHGARGSGKSSLLRSVAWGDVDDYPDGVVYMEASQSDSAQDLVQAIYRHFFNVDSEDPVRLDDQLIQTELSEIDALIILDDIQLADDEVERLQDALGSAVFVLAGEHDDEIEFIKRLEVGGLGADEALALFEMHLTSEISEEDRDAAREICKELGGHPGLIIEAANCRDSAETSLAELARTYRESADAGAVATALLSEGLPPEAKAAVKALAEAGTAVRIEVLAAALGMDIDDELRELLRSQRVESHSPRFSLTGSLAESIRSDWGPEQWMGDLLKSLAEWAESDAATIRKIDEDREFILRAMAWGNEAAQWEDVIRVARAVDKGLAMSAKWDVWEQSLQHALRAAELSGDLSAVAWAKHQLGTRSIGLGDEETAVAHLREAMDQRKQLASRSSGLSWRERWRERQALRVTRHNLRLSKAPALLTASLILLAVLAILIPAFAIDPPPPDPIPGDLKVEPNRLVFPESEASRGFSTFTNTGESELALELIVSGDAQFEMVSAAPTDAFQTEAAAVQVVRVAFTPTSSSAEGVAGPTCAIGDRVATFELPGGTACRVTVEFVGGPGRFTAHLTDRMAGIDLVELTTGLVPSPDQLGNITLVNETDEVEVTVSSQNVLALNGVIGPGTLLFTEGLAEAEYTVTVAPAWPVLVGCQSGQAPDKVPQREVSSQELLTINLEQNESVTCVLTSIPPETGAITFTNETDNLQVTVSSVSGPDGLVGPGATRSAGGLPPDSYVVTLDPDEPVLVQCGSAQAPEKVPQREVSSQELLTINLEQNESVTCVLTSIPPETGAITFTNDTADVTVTVSSEQVGLDGVVGPGGSLDWTGLLPDEYQASVVPNEPVLARCSSELDPGKVPSREISSDASLAVRLEPGESVSCVLEDVEPSDSRQGVLDIDHELVVIGPAETTIRLKNVGNKAIELRSISAESLQLTSDCGRQLGGGESCEIFVTITEPIPDPACWILEIDHDGEGDRRVLLKVEGN